MESQRGLLFVGLLVVSFLLFQQWQVDNAPVQQPTQESQDVPQNNANSGEEFVPASSDTASEVDVNTQTTSAGGVITVTTDVLEFKIDTQGGDIIAANLLAYETEQDSGIAMPILTEQGFTYVAQSGLIGAQGPDASASGRPIYNTSATEYSLAEGSDSLKVDLTFNKDGINVTKSFEFKKGAYDVAVNYQVNNQTQTTASVQLYAQLKQSSYVDSDSSMMMPTYRGAAYSTTESRYEKYDFDDIEDANLKETTKGGWVGMLQHYFVSAWVPESQATNQLYTRYLANNGQAVIGFKAPVTTVAAGATETLTSTFYVGPKDQEKLEKIAEGLDLTVDYGFLWMISQPLFWLLLAIQEIVVNWGVAIIMITIVVKTLMYPLTKTQYTSMAKMRKIQPKMAALKERYGDDRQKMSQSMMELYRKEKVNPAGGCLPLILQMPIFLALYWVFMESVELRHAEFALWITDLSSKDPYYILPILMGASMFLMQKLQPAMTTDPMQQKMMQWMPVFFTFFFLWFPSGLVLYWLVSNVITIIQMLIIFKSIEKAEEQAKLKGKAK
ncbi:MULTISPECIES: membrane protein insertase YidC [unclassified Thalassotalea]|uniref:membrane protein insertase YidC n=1 Tax=unclassified Thalassotalea TaxID=2614972 RepID=UPI001080C18C|nr:MULTISPECIES: membrane protein insertase YidC [unclassified Thalassotalea]NMP17835.1 membrane protein insertase YidC [Thalassotalea sp. Y01]QBY04415.1 membrane protein insertase YidC [Thalassotalea sp. HSM 43]